MSGARMPLLWLLGLIAGTVGTSFLYQAVTAGSASALLAGLALFLPALYVCGTVLARARRVYRSSRRGAVHR